MQTRNILEAARNIVLAALLCLTPLAGCDMGFTPRDERPEGATGAVRVTIAAEGENGAQSASQTDARTVVPDNPGFAYTLSFSAEGRSPVTATPEGNTGEVTLNTGTWTLIVTGKKDGVTVAESDPVSVTVPEGGTAVSVLVHPALNGAAGTFRYAVFADAGLSGVSAALTPLNVGDAAQNETALVIGAASTQTVAPGYYRLTVRAMKGTQPLIRRETVHIYSSTQTFKSYNLTEADFAPVIYLGGILSGGITGYKPAAVAAYEDAACNVFIDERAVSGDWSLAVEDTLTTVYFKVRLEKTDGGSPDGTSAVYYSKPVPVTGIPAGGKMDLVLQVEGYTVTFDANGGAFEGGGTAVTMTAPENGTLTLPSAPQGEHRFAGWLNADERFTTETRITGDTTFYAGWLIGAADIEGYDIVDYLTNADGGDSSVNPVMLKLSLDLANGGWDFLLSAIAAAGKYVSLDLSVCPMNGTEFDLGTGAGANRVIALILPDTAKSVKARTSDNYTFNAFTNLASISGAGVETIGSYAFYDCRNLTTVNLPAAVTIDSYAFYDCRSLTTVSQPAAVTIGYRAFSYCGNLTSVSLPTAVTIGDEAFNSCTSLTSVSLPAAVTINSYAFRNCTSLTSVSLPVVAAINGSAFSGCSSLTAITVDPAMFTVRDGMLLNKAETTLIAYPSASGAITLPSVTEIGRSAFSGCESLTTVSLPAAVTIGYEAFYDCRSLTEVSLPAAQTIGSYAFSYCRSLTEVSLPAAVTIVEQAFWACPSLTTVSLPAAETIGYYAFSYCRSLTEVSLPAVPPSIGYYSYYSYSVFRGTGSDGTITVSVPAGRVFAYTSAWGVDASTPADGNTGVYGSDHKAVLITDPTGGPVDSPLTGLDGLASAPDGNTASDPVSLTLSGSFTSDSWGATLSVIAASGKYAALDLSACTMTYTKFEPGIGTGADRITALILPDAAKSVPAGTSGNPAFKAFTALTSLSGAGVEAIYSNVVSGCTNLTTVSLPAAVTIGAYAFSDNGYPYSYCTSLTTVSLSAAETIGEYAFQNCTSLTEVSLPAAQTIGSSAFSSCTSLTEVSLPVAQTIGSSAFYSCTSLTEVSLPATPPSIYTGFDYGIFRYTGTSGTITVRVPAGAVSAYTSAWKVSANTAANGNTGVYGYNHKAVSITDAQ